MPGQPGRETSAQVSELPWFSLGAYCSNCLLVRMLPRNPQALLVWGWLVAARAGFYRCAEGGLCVAINMWALLVPFGHAAAGGDLLKFRVATQPNHLLAELKASAVLW